MKGLYVGSEFVSFAELKKSQPHTQRIASRGTVSGFGSLNSVLPNPDPILKKMGKDIQVYKEIKAEAGVKGCLRRRKSAVKSKAWRIVQDQATPETAERIQQIFNNLPLSRIIGAMADASFFGYQPCEITWAYQDGAWLPVDIQAMPPDWYFFDSENRLRFRDKDAGQDGLLIPERKYLVPTQDATYENPYGEPDASSVFWATTFKQGGLDFWVRFTEKYGSPWVIGKYGRNYDIEQQEQLLDNLSAMVQDAVAVIPDNSTIDIIEAGGKSSSSDAYERFLMFCRSEVNIALLGQNQSTESDATRASSQAGAEVAFEIALADCEIVAEQLQILINWIVDYNWGGIAPRFEFFEDSNGGLEQAQRDSTLTQAGVRFTSQYFMREYGLQDGDIEQETSLPQSQSFAEPEQKKDFVSQTTEELETHAQPYLDDMVNRLKNIVAKTTSFDELQNQIMTEFDDLNSGELVKVMEIAMTLANLQGRSEV